MVGTRYYAYFKLLCTNLTTTMHFIISHLCPLGMSHVNFSVNLKPHSTTKLKMN